MDIKGQIAAVTGGASGLGRATAQILAAAGAKVIILDKDFEKATAVATEAGGIAAAVDVSEESSVRTALLEAAARVGGVPRIVVNCAGIGLSARIVGRNDTFSFDVFEKTIRVNLVGTYNVMSHAAALMLKLDPLPGGERGVIINTSSVAFEDGQLGQAAYAASKGAISAMVLPAAREFGKFGIRVMAIAPGLFDTAMTKTLDPEITKAIASNIPFPARLGSAEEFGMLAEHIVRNPYLNGTTIRLDGSVRLPPK